MYKKIIIFITLLHGIAGFNPLMRSTNIGSITHNYLKTLYRPYKSNNTLVHLNAKPIYIQSTTFDNLFMHICNKNVKKAIITNNNDRIITILNNDKSFIFHNNENNDIIKIKKLMYIVKEISQIIIVSNLHEYLSSVYGLSYKYNITNDFNDL
jgi:hypothetical protein